jgi:hypothetical protein
MRVVHGNKLLQRTFRTLAKANRAARQHAIVRSSSNK